MIFTLLDVNDGYKAAGFCNEAPICGVDFCDECGCCLDCYNECPCCPRAFVYSDRLDEWMDKHGMTENPFKVAD